jgi:hypothetical protein
MLTSRYFSCVSAYLTCEIIYIYFKSATQLLDVISNSLVHPFWQKHAISYLVRKRVLLHERACFSHEDDRRSSFRFSRMCRFEENVVNIRKRKLPFLDPWVPSFTMSFTINNRIAWYNVMSRMYIFIIDFISFPNVTTECKHLKPSKNAHSFYTWLEENMTRSS